MDVIINPLFWLKLSQVSKRGPWLLLIFIFNVRQTVIFFRPNDVYMRQYTGPSLVHIMAILLFSLNPAPDAMLVFCLCSHAEKS